MNAVRVEFEDVWKKFRRGERATSLRDAIPAIAGWFVPKPGGHSPLARDEFHSLSEINFSVGAGECVGIIGHNGAGKSTLLKCASRILRPNRGQVRMHGRVSALIEVGAGFHPDLSGRENVFLNGTILGMKRREIVDRFDQIVEFAGMKEFIDTPVKRYSSGMHARLGFAVAAFMDPDVLLIDEVLAVGDMSFARKCEQKILQIVEGDTTVLFVSHNLSAVRLISDRVLVLDRGRLVFDGDPSEAIHRYQELLIRRDNQGQAHPAIGSLALAITDELGTGTLDVTTGGTVHVDLELVAARRIRDCSLGFFLKDEDDNLLYQCWGDSIGADPVDVQPGQTFRCRFRISANLLPGTYWVGSIVRGRAEGDGHERPVNLDKTPNRAQLVVAGRTEASGSANLFAECLVDTLSITAPRAVEVA